MFPIPWISVTHSRTGSSITDDPEVFNALKIEQKAHPLFTCFIGKRSKTDILSELLHRPKGEHLADPHRQVLLHLDSSTIGDKCPRVFVDSELHLFNVSSETVPTGTLRGMTREFTWSEAAPGPFMRRTIANLFHERVLGPLCDVICYFATDLGGMRQVASSLVDQINYDAPTDLPSRSRPSVLIITETSSSRFDEQIAEHRFIDTIQELLKHSDPEPTVMDSNAQIHVHFDQIRIIGLSKRESRSEHARMIHRRLSTMHSRCVLSRVTQRTLFRRDHAYSFVRKLLDHFSATISRPLSLVASSRPQGFSISELPTHIRELMSILPSEVWICHLLCPLLLSAIRLASFPPGSHRFSLSWIYSNIFEKTIKVTINERLTLPASRKGFFRAMSKGINDMDNPKDQNDTNVVIEHLGVLSELRPYFIKIRSHKTCFCCLLSAPEKTLSCGHALCNTCIQIVGKKSNEEKWTFDLPVCPLCGTSLSEVLFHLVPPTAGIRMLSLDGGGIKGVVQLEILKRLEFLTKDFHLPVRDHFDFVCGTSAGGLIIMGLFLMLWPVDECIQKFETLAIKTFKQNRNGLLIFSRLQELLMSYLRDCQYSSLAIAEAFQSSIGTELKMFNPLNNDTKVAVTTTSVKETLPCLFTNYNGEKRPEDIGYSILRAKSADHDASISEAAACTSAAPWYFRSKSLEHLGTFQDGGLRFNNPLNIALWEIKFIWPGKSLDFAISIGTGMTKASISAFISGPQSPVRDRFLSRIFQTFMRNIDGEKIWKEIYNSLPENTKHRYHRMNFNLDGTEPSLDDVGAMEDLKRQATAYIELDKTIQPVLDSLLASIFYFEFDDVPIYSDGEFSCSGHIFCRLQLPLAGRRHLYNTLNSTSSFFLVMGRPTPCIDKVPKSLPPFKRRILFRLPSLSDVVWIRLRGLTSLPCTISGLPQSAETIIKMQKLGAPFGRADHVAVEKPLPSIPQKRRLRS